jgi:hypothetical protein
MRFHTCGGLDDVTLDPIVMPSAIYNGTTQTRDLDNLVSQQSHISLHLWWIMENRLRDPEPGTGIVHTMVPMLATTLTEQQSHWSMHQHYRE